MWECPDLFELPVDGDAANTRWVLVVNLSPGGIAGGSGGQYFIGTFDGVDVRFRDHRHRGASRHDDSRMAEYGWLDWGRDYYAAVSFSNAPDGRRLMIGWMNNWQYGAVTPTRRLAQRDVTGPGRQAGYAGGRVVLVQAAVDPFGNGGATTYSEDRQDSRRRDDAGFLPRPPVMCCGSTRNWSPATPGGWVCVLRAGGGEQTVRSGPGAGARTVLAYDCRTAELSLDRTASGNMDFHESFASVERVAVPLEDGRLRLRVFLDRCSVEVFAQDGLATITDQVFPGEASTSLAVFATGGRATLVSLDVVR